MESVCVDTCRRFRSDVRAGIRGEKIDETDITKNYTFLLGMSSDSTILAGNSRPPTHSRTYYETSTSLPTFLPSYFLHRLYSRKSHSHTSKPRGDSWNRAGEKSDDLLDERSCKSNG